MFLRILTPYTNGKHLDDPAMRDIVVYRRAKSIHVQAPKRFAYSLDGEVIYKNDFTAEIVPQALNMAVPE